MLRAALLHVILLPNPEAGAIALGPLRDMVAF